MLFNTFDEDLCDTRLMAAQLEVSDKAHFEVCRVDHKTETSWNMTSLKRICV